MPLRSVASAKSVYSSSGSEIIAPPGPGSPKPTRHMVLWSDVWKRCALIERAFLVKVPVAKFSHRPLSFWMPTSTRSKPAPPVSVAFPNKLIGPLNVSPSAMAGLRISVNGKDESGSLGLHTPSDSSADANATAALCSPASLKGALLAFALAWIPSTMSVGLNPVRRSTRCTPGTFESKYSASRASESASVWGLGTSRVPSPSESLWYQGSTLPRKILVVGLFA